MRLLISILILLIHLNAYAGELSLLERERIKAASAYSRDHDGYALIIARNSRVIHEEYFNGSSSETPQRIASIAKNFWGIAALAAADDGILNLDRPVSDVITEWRDDALRNRITVSDLLNMVSGLDSGFRAIYLEKPRNVPAAALKLPVVDAPGAVFQYGPANMEVLGEVFRRVLRPRGMGPLEFLQKRILTPLGIEHAEWKEDRAGNPAMSGGAKMRAGDMLSLGLLVLKKGDAGGRQLIDPALFSGAVIHGSFANPVYGMTFWLNGNARHRDSLEVNVEEVLEAKDRFNSWERASVALAAPSDMLTMIGSGNQRVYVIPSLDTVIVRQGYGTQFRDSEFMRLLMPDSLR